jgi:hypothetical protein
VHARGLVAPGGRQRVVSAGSLSGRILRIFTAAISPGLATTTVITVATGSRLVISGRSDTVPRALRLGAATARMRAYQHDPSRQPGRGASADNQPSLHRIATTSAARPHTGVPHSAA